MYNNAFDALRKIWKFEGLSGIQRGLGAAYAYQILLYAFPPLLVSSLTKNLGTVFD